MRRRGNLPAEELSRRAREYEALVARPLKAKVAHSQQLVADALRESGGKVAVACSFGKDSMVLLDLVRQQVPSVPVVWCNTGVEFPETVRFALQVSREMGLNLHIARPRKTFWRCVEEYGWPLFGKYVRASRAPGRGGELHRKLLQARASSRCCYWLKEKPAEDTYRILGVKGVFVGITGEESWHRRGLLLDYGPAFRDKKTSLWRCYPLAYWREEDVWQYTRERGLPVNPLYELGHRRTGCWPCGMDILHPDNHLARLRQTHPKLWQLLIVDKGLGKELLKARLALRDGQGDLWADSLSIEQLLEHFPCFFDRVVV